jgi:hypothetical protein
MTIYKGVNNRTFSKGFTFTDDKMSLIFKDKAFDIALNEFMYVLNPLEYKSLPLIWKIEKML